MVRFGVLGPVAAVGPHGWESPSATKQRTLLAVLLVHRGRVVPTARIVAELWAGDPPAQAERAVRSHLHRLGTWLRGALGEQPIVRGAGGWALRLDAGDLDADRAAELRALAVARLAAGDPAAAAELAADAHALWRGPALADVRAPALDRTHRPRLDEQQLTLQELVVDCGLALGRHADLVPRLLTLVAEHPLRERLTGQLMTAAARAGRHGDALAAYERLRVALRHAQGTEPGVELRRRHLLLLGREPADPPRPAAPPAELPPDVPELVGRTGEVHAVCTALAAGRTPVLVTGPPGSGTSALVVHAAHRLRSAFPGGQVHVPLRAPDGRPLPPAEVAVRVRAALDRLGGGRALLVLDGADADEQVRAATGLGPAGVAAGVAVVVAAAHRLPLVPDAHRVPLGPLRPAAAFALLAGTGRVDGAMADVLRYCAGLPLAVRIAGARLAARPHLTVAALARALADPARRLDELRAGDQDVRSGVLRSYTGATAAEQEVFRRLGGGRPVDDRDALAGLVDRHLLTPGHHLPDLVADVARELGQPGRLSP